jgi:hypothetical protein
MYFNTLDDDILDEDTLDEYDDEWNTFFHFSKICVLIPKKHQGLNGINYIET